jgi:opacity protein-like surface antigen
MKSLKRTAVLISALGIYSQSAYADFAVSVTAGSADYELELIENPGAENEFVDAIDDTFFYRDLGIDYSWGNHQVGVKIGGLDESKGAIDIRDSSPQAATVETGDAKRDEWSLFYTYRTPWGIALTTGYYSSETDTTRNFSADIQDLLNNGSNVTAQLSQSADKTVDNDGWFVGAAYGRPLTERIGVFARLGYQWSEMEESIDAARDFTIPVQTGVTQAFTQSDSFSRSGDFDGNAFVYGVGAYWAVSESYSLNLFYEVKDFDYDSGTYDGETRPVKISEEQSMVGLTLRYSR